MDIPEKNKNLNANGGKGASRGASGTKRNVKKAPSKDIQGNVKY